MDLLWSGLARRASEYTRTERRSQFDRIHEIAFKSAKSQDQNEDI